MAWLLALGAALLASRPGATAGAPPALKVGLFDPVRAFDGVTACLLGKLGAKPGELDAKLTPQYAQHLSQFWLTKRLKEDPHTVADPAEADVLVVTAPVFVSWVAAQHGCGTMPEHRHRMDLLARELRHSPAFASSKPILMPHTWWECEAVWGNEFFDVMNNRNMILGTSDTFFCKELHFTRRVILPYVAHGGLDALAQKPGPAVRPWRFFFHGSTNRVREGQYRQRLVRGLEPLLPAANFQLLLLSQHTQLLDIVADTAHAVARAQYCLVLPGDTTTSRRLFDALASGCVPVVFDVSRSSAVRPEKVMYLDWRDDGYKHNLPFPRSLDWESFAVFMGPVREAVFHVGATAQALKGLPDLRKGGARSQRAYKDALSYYHGTGLVTCLLRELEYLLQQPAYRRGLLAHAPPPHAAHRAQLAEQQETDLRTQGANGTAWRELSREYDQVALWETAAREGTSSRRPLAPARRARPAARAPPKPSPLNDALRRLVQDEKRHAAAPAKPQVAQVAYLLTLHTPLAEKRAETLQRECRGLGLDCEPVYSYLYADFKDAFDLTAQAERDGVFPKVDKSWIYHFTGKTGKGNLDGLSCTLGHRKVWTLISRLPGSELHLVLEDDSHFVGTEPLSSLRARPTTDIVLLSATNKTSSIAYALTPRAARKLLNHTVSEPVDLTLTAEVARGYLTAEKRAWVNESQVQVNGVATERSPRRLDGRGGAHALLQRAREARRADVEQLAGAAPRTSGAAPAEARGSAPPAGRAPEAHERVFFHAGAGRAAGEARTVWIVGFGRSGTSLVQEVVYQAAEEAGHSVFGAFEPCHREDRYFGVTIGENAARMQQCLAQVLRCDFSGLPDLRFQNRTDALAPGYGGIGQRCREAQVRVFKTIYPAPMSGSSLGVAPPGTKVLRIVRDPRAIFSSMRGLPEMRLKAPLPFAQTLCEQMQRWTDDPRPNVHNVVFEDLVTTVVPVARAMVDFIGVELTPTFKTYLASIFSPPTCPPADRPKFSTCRTAAETQETLTKWRDLLSLAEKRPFTSPTCTSTLSEYGYATRYAR